MRFKKFELTLFNLEHVLLGIQFMNYDAVNQLTGDVEGSGNLIMIGFIFGDISFYFE